MSVFLCVLFHRFLCAGVVFGAVLGDCACCSHGREDDPREEWISEDQNSVPGVVSTVGVVRGHDTRMFGRRFLGAVVALEISRML